MTDQRRPRSSNAATYLALASLLAVAGALLFLSYLVLPQIFYFLLVIVGMGAFVGLHYVVWGWWLVRRPYEEHDEQDEKPPSAE